MPRILVFGDSNAWGYEPGTGRRYPKGIRWPTVMQEALGPAWDLVEEGMNGRTTVFEDPIEPHRNGLSYLPACLLSHAPLDVVVIALGINDLKRRFSLSAADIADGAGRLIQVAKTLGKDAEDRAPQIVLVAPAPLGPLTAFADRFAGGTATSHDLKHHYQRVAAANRVHGLAMGDTIALSDRDGIHMDAAAHDAWGRRMADFVGALVLPG
jgi:lysophospholipase L1-like esterase